MAVIRRFEGPACPNGCRGVARSGDATWRCHACRVDAVQVEYVVLRAADYEAMVPCDDAAIERAARALLVASTANAHYPGDQWDAVSAGAQDEMREWARAALRAAGETP